jgi:uncharacterized membrane protein
MMTAWFSGRWGRAVCVASLVLNLFLVGYLIGRALDVWPAKPKRAETFVERLAARLPERDAEIVRRAVARQTPTIDSLVKAVRDSRRQVRAALTAEPFDRRALEAALQESRTRHHALETAVQAIVLETAGELSPEARGRLLWSKRGHRH